MLPAINELERFDDAFLATFYASSERGEIETGVAFEPRTSPPPVSPPNDTAAPPSGHRASDGPSAPSTLLLMSSDEERLAHRDFALLTPEEEAQLIPLIERLRLRGEYRISRRRKRTLRGNRLDVARMLRLAMRTCGEPVRRAYSIPRTRRRRLIFLCDVSGSMAPYARAMLIYAHASVRARPGVFAFAFATRLTELTRAMSDMRAQRFLQRLPSMLPDYSGGTRIADALDVFLERPDSRGAARGSTIVILSDGWERESPERVAIAMQRLRLLAHRIVWVNPNKKHPAFEPLVRGMAAALPHVDDFLDGHNLRTLAQVQRAIELAEKLQ
jgi:uncharacterized protein with von Willebrand factor type A (vWA) domain